MRKVLTEMSFSRLTRGSAEQKADTTLQANSSQSGRSSGVRLRLVRRVSNVRTSQPRMTKARPIHAPAIECGAQTA